MTERVGRQRSMKRDGLRPSRPGTPKGSKPMPPLDIPIDQINSGKTIAELSQADAAKILLAVRAAEDGFLGFVRFHHPEWAIPQFNLEIIDILDKLERRTLTHPDTGELVYNVILNIPPRHNKSTLATKLFPAYCIARAPFTKALISGASQDLADGFGYETRNYIRDWRTNLAYPDLSIDPHTRAKNDWRTLQGGQYLAIGIKGNTIGRPANLLIVDDPYSGRQAAESPARRLEIQDHWDGSLFKRREPDAHGRPPITILIHTRWHPDDLTGRIVASEDYKEGQWLHVVYKGITEVDSEVETNRSNLDPSDPRYMPQEQMRGLPTYKKYVKARRKQALWPERFSLEWLEREQRRTPREFEAQYQQSPYVRGGSLIQSKWWQFYSTQDDNLPTITSVIIAVDGAFKRTEGSDYTAAVTVGLAEDGDIYVLDVMRRKMDFPEAKRALIQLNNRWRGRGLKAIYIEDKASGIPLLQELRHASGMSVLPYKVITDKTARVHAITPLIEGGRVLLPKEANWLELFLEECEQFPNGNHDDQVDAMTMAIEVLSRTPTADANNFNFPLSADDSLFAQMNRQQHAFGASNAFGTADPFGTQLNRRSAADQWALGE